MILIKDDHTETISSLSSTFILVNEKVSNNEDRITSLEVSQVEQDSEMTNIRKIIDQNQISIKSDIASMEDKISVMNKNLDGLKNEYDEDRKEINKRFDDSTFNLM